MEFFEPKGERDEWSRYSCIRCKQIITVSVRYLTTQSIFGLMVCRRKCLWRKTSCSRRLTVTELLTCDLTIRQLMELRFSEHSFGISSSCWPYAVLDIWDTFRDFRSIISVSVQLWRVMLDLRAAVTDCKLVIRIWRRHEWYSLYAFWKTSESLAALAYIRHLATRYFATIGSCSCVCGVFKHVSSRTLCSSSFLFADKHMVVLPTLVTTLFSLYKHLLFFILISEEDSHSFCSR